MKKIQQGLIDRSGCDLRAKVLGAWDDIGGVLPVSFLQFPSMAPRLLTLLNLIENALANQGSTAVAVPPLRSVSFHKGMARMSFADGSGSILLQNFTLADGQICVRAVFFWAVNPLERSHSIYPREDFDWLGAADQIARGWLAGQTGESTSAPADSVAMEELGERADPVVATG